MLLDQWPFWEPLASSRGVGWPNFMRNIPTKAGPTIDEHTALSLPAVFCAVDLLATTLGMLPVHAYERMGEGKRERRGDHQAEHLLNREPNPEQSPMAFKRAMHLHTILWGNGRAEVLRGAVGQPKELRLLLPHVTKTRRAEDGTLYYTERQANNAEPRTIKHEDVVHTTGLSYDGIEGYGLVAQLARQNLGLGMAIFDYAATFFGNSTMLGNILSVPETMSKEAKAENAKAWNESRENFKAVILDGGMTVSQLTQPNKAAQTLETMTYSVQDIARWTRVPPPMLMELSNGTFNNTTELGRWFVKFTKLPWVVLYGQEFGRKLFDPEERRTYYLKFNLEALLQGDYKTRVEGRSLEILNGTLSPNEARELEDRNPREDDEGDKYLRPLNTTIAGEEEEKTEAAPFPPPRKTNEDDPGEAARTEAVYRDRLERLKKSHCRLFADAASRVLRKEAMAAKRAAKAHAGDADGFHGWSARFYDKHCADVISTFSPPTLALAELAAETGGLSATAAERAGLLVKGFATMHTSQSVAELHDAFEGGAEAAVSTCVADWEINRPGDIAVQLTEQVVALTFEEPVHGD